MERRMKAELFQDSGSVKNRISGPLRGHPKDKERERRIHATRISPVVLGSEEGAEIPIRFFASRLIADQVRRCLLLVINFLNPRNIPNINVRIQERSCRFIVGRSVPLAPLLWLRWQAEASRYRPHRPRPRRPLRVHQETGSSRPDQR